MGNPIKIPSLVPSQAFSGPREDGGGGGIFGGLPSSFLTEWQTFLLQFERQMANYEFDRSADQLYIVDAIRIGTGATYIDIDGGATRVRSSNYVAGITGAGFTLEPGLLEVGNIRARGMIRAGVFQKDVMSIVGGNLLVRPGDVLAADMTALDASTLEIEGNETFSVGDFLRIKDGTDDEWLEVTGAGSAPIYTVTRDKNSDYTANNNPVWKKGISVSNYGASGDGGVYMTSSDANAPYLSVFTHAGSPWSTINTKVRLGELNGFAGYSSSTFGLAIYEDADNYLKFDPTNGIRIAVSATNAITIKNGSDISLEAGGDIILTGSDSDSAQLEWITDGTNIIMGAYKTSDNFSIYPSTANNGSFYIGYTPDATLNQFSYIYMGAELLVQLRANDAADVNDFSSMYCQSTSTSQDVYLYSIHDAATATLLTHSGTDNARIEVTGDFISIAGYAYALGGIHVGGTSDPGDDNLVVDGYLDFAAISTESLRTLGMQLVTSAADGPAILWFPSDSLYFKSGSTGGAGSKFVFDDGGNATADDDDATGGWGTFCPQIAMDEPTIFVLEDIIHQVNKPAKPYVGIKGTQKEKDLYCRWPLPIAMGAARILERVVKYLNSQGVDLDDYQEVG